MKLKIGTKVKVIKRDVARCGEVGEVVEYSKTMIGWRYKVEFNDGTNGGWYGFEDLREI